MRVRLAAGLSLLAAILQSPVAASAEPLPAADRGNRVARFQYERGSGAEQCPDASLVRRSVQGHLGYDPFDDSAALQVRCRISIQHGKWLAVINVSDRASGRSGERRILSSHPNCSAVADAAALAIAIAIDPLLPEASTSAGTTLDTPASPPPPADEGPKASLPPPAAHPTSGEGEGSGADIEQASIPVVFSVGAGASLSEALQPTAALGLSVAFAARRGPLSLALEARWREPSHLTYLQGTISAQVLSAAVFGCGHPGPMTICCLVDTGAVLGSAEGYLHSAHATTSFVAPGLRVGWRPSLFRNGSILIHMTGLAPVVRTTLWVDPQSVWTMPRLAAEAGILGFFSFP